ncbi:MAG: glutamine-hydrolyzing GMP synthase [Oligoflexia bacterium]|nr:glutamine-hydrolyzing GMP synthase [Oligoflexia bacterium]
MHLKNNFKKILILDFGGQYAHLLAQKIRKLKIYSLIVNPEEVLDIKTSDDFTSDFTNDLCGVILSGGPESVLDGYDDHIKKFFDSLMIKGIPILGICYGHQLLAHLYGGKISKGVIAQYGKTRILVDHSSPTPLYQNIPAQINVWMSHMDYVDYLNDKFIVTSYSENKLIASYEMKNYPLFGLQFHPEVTHSDFGESILDNFINVCLQQLPSDNRIRDWDNELQLKSIIEYIKTSSEGKKLIILVSGGVDSVVALKLCSLAKNPSDLFPLHIDTGLLRLNESSEVLKYLKTLNIPNINFLDASEYFYKKLEGIIDPEEKRKIIGEAFIESVNSQFKFDNDDFSLVQGTIYPDTIESGSAASRSHTIKTHHNRVEGILNLISQGKIIEPLKNLYKDEVRVLGKYLSIDEKLINRRPFPGPGLAIRIVSSFTATNDNDDNKSLVLPVAVPVAGLEGLILPIKSVGVQGDQRSFKNPLLLFKSKENKTFVSSKLIKELSSSLINDHKEINRVLWAPFDDLHFIKRLKTKTNLINQENVKLLQLLDHQIEKILSAYNDIWQSLTVSLPLFDSENDTYNENNQIFVLRAVTSVNAMTADGYDFPKELLEELNISARKIKGVSSLWFDLTSKPPATIEWE